jgi:two-component system, cell cycle response regulator
MTERIPMRYTVALLGFSEFERGALASYFRLDAARSPAYAQTADVASADFIVADADQPATVAAVALLHRQPDTVFVGAHAPDDAGAWLPRPIDPTHIVRELDLLLELRLASLDEPGNTGWMVSASAPLDPSQPLRDVLVVDDSRVALRFLQVRLQRLGYRVHVAQTSAQALARLAEQALALVFLDVVLAPDDEMDGLQLCRHIKQQAGLPGGVPKVLLTTGLASSSDRVRGALAGCDAYLTKPLLADEFTAALRLLSPLRVGVR